MFDNNFIPVPCPLADNGTPIVLNNACGSWHRLAETFTFGDARAYIGTLFSVSNLEAQDVVMKVLGQHFGKPLAVALWHAQNGVYQESIRRPYLMVGTHFQRLRATAQNTPQYLIERLARSKRYWAERASGFDRVGSDPIDDYVSFLDGEINGLLHRFKAD